MACGFSFTVAFASSRSSVGMHPCVPEREATVGSSLLSTAELTAGVNKACHNYTGEGASEIPHLLNWWKLMPLVPSGATRSR